MQARIQQLKDRTKCHICLQPEHWKRECPKKDSKKNATIGKASGKKGGPSNRDVHDSMVADYEQVYHGGTWMSQEAREVSVSHSGVFFAEKDLEDVETLLAQEGSVSSYEQKGGTLTRAVFRSF